MEFSKLEQFYKDDAYCGFKSSEKEINFDRYNEYALYVKQNIQGPVYEIGSGLGLAAIALKKMNIDISATDIFPENARKTFKQLNIDIPVINLNINAINFPDHNIPNYCLYQVMEHIENPKLALSEIYRTLKPGGSLILVGPNLISPLATLKSFFMGITRVWKTPLFKRDDDYRFPMGGTILEIIFLLIKNTSLTFLKYFFKSKRNIIFREPCLVKPAVSDSDAVIYLNPLDMKQILEETGFHITGFQNQKKFGIWAGSTWIVATKPK